MFAKQSGGAVLDGRDIGTVICPDADVKLFVPASANVRAERRFIELSAKDGSITPERVLADIKLRDARDADRDIAPMVAADDAYEIDTSNMKISEAIATAITIIEKAKA